jgi:hypothetical protein
MNKIKKYFMIDFIVFIFCIIFILICLSFSVLSFFDGTIFNVINFLILTLTFILNAYSCYLNWKTELEIEDYYGK